MWYNLVHNHKISLAKSTKLMQYQIEFVCCLLPKDDLLTSSIIYLSDIDVEHVGPNNDAEHGGWGDCSDAESTMRQQIEII